MKRLLPICLAAACWLGCAQGNPPADNERPIQPVVVEFDQDTAVRSSILRFRLLGTADREATIGSLHFSGSLGEGRELDETYYVPVDRVGERGDLVLELRVEDALWSVIDPQPRRSLSGRIDVAVEDQIGVFASGEVDNLVLRFEAELPPTVAEIDDRQAVFPGERVPIVGTGFLRPEEGTTWAVVDEGSVRFGENASRSVTNARVAVEWTGTRSEGVLPISPSVFGVRSGEFQGNLRFENKLATGELFQGSAQERFRASLRPPRIDDISPGQGSRGQKVTISGRGFVADTSTTESGTYFVLNGVLDPDDGGIPLVFDNDEVLLTPHRVVSERTVEQEVSYSVDPLSRTLQGLGAIPGSFEGTITPYIYHGSEEEGGVAWEGIFRVLPTKQVVYVKYLPGFSRALEQYGLGTVEPDVRARILQVLHRDYAEANVEFLDDEPESFVEFTTIEVGGPDPSGLLNFGYDNSFNDGGKDIGNLYLSDYLGGVNRHSQDAGYLPFGGVFIESFIAFSPTLYPDNFGTSEDFDRVMSPFMPGLDGTPVSATEWPDGPRSAAIRGAVEMMGNLTGHTASHEVGHALGLAHFPQTVENFAELFHNDPPGANLIMDAGADRPFAERAELNGQGPASFSSDNLRYLRQILPRP